MNGTATLAESARTDDGTSDLTVQITRLQRTLASRLLLGFAVPLAVILVLAGYAYQLSSRLKEVEALERVNFIERFYRDTRNLAWAIEQYDDLLKRYRSPHVLVRLGNLYFERSKPGGPGSLDPDDVELAVKTLEAANTLHVERARVELWEALALLNYIHLEVAQTQTDRTRRVERERESIRTGERALALNARSDGQTYNNLAWIYATSPHAEIRDLKKAERYAVKAVEITRWRNRDYLDTLDEVHRRMADLTKREAS